MTKNCRMCGSMRLRQFLDLGFTPPADGFLRAEQLLEPETHYPLQVCQCEDCGLAQLTHVVSPEILYRHDYPYESSITRSGQLHWQEFAQNVSARFDLGEADLVVDVGSNVGVLLDRFRSHGTRVLGVDPASNIVRIAERRGIETWDEFFGLPVARRIRDERGAASLITATNVFAHVDDLREFMLAVDLLLDDRGVFIFEAPQFRHLVQQFEYDTIYHEHLSYLSLKPLLPFLHALGLEVFDVEERDIHGGSFRVFVGRHGDRPVAAAVDAMLRAEEASGIYEPLRLGRFARDVAANRDELASLLSSLKSQGKRIAGVSAPAKGMTLLNYCGIGAGLLDFVTEKSQLKIGRFTPGSHIPVVSDAELLRQRPDFALLLAWNFGEEIMQSLHEYVQGGGRFIIPVPHPRIVEPSVSAH